VPPEAPPPPSLLRAGKGGQEGSPGGTAAQGRPPVPPSLPPPPALLRRAAEAEHGLTADSGAPVLVQPPVPPKVPPPPALLRTSGLSSGGVATLFPRRPPTPPLIRPPAHLATKTVGDAQGDGAGEPVPPWVNAAPKTVPPKAKVILPKPKTALNPPPLPPESSGKAGLSIRLLHKAKAPPKRMPVRSPSGPGWF